MNPHDAGYLVTLLGQLFGPFTPPAREVLQRMLEPYPYATAFDVIMQYAQETSTLDRGELRTLLSHEHNRRTPRVSSAAGWRMEKEAEVKERDAFLNKFPPRRVRAVLEQLRKRQPDVFCFIPEPMTSDFGLTLICNELKRLERT